MQYDYSDDQKLLQDSLRRFVQDHYDYESRRRLVASELGYSRECWQQLANLGVLGLPFAEQHGGLDADVSWLMLVAEELGRGLALEPFLAGVVLTGSLLRRAENIALLNALAPRIAAGELIMGLAWEERAAQGNPCHIELRAERDGDAYLLSGEKLAVLAAPQAEKLIVSARTAGGVSDRDGISLFVLDGKTPGLTLQSYASADGQRAATLLLDRVRVTADRSLMTIGGGGDLLSAALRDALAVMGAEACGVAEELLTMTAEYCATRKQFGTPLAAFQALQHRLADMFIASEKLRSLTWGAIQPGDTGEAIRASAALKAAIGDAGRYIGQQAVQLHGGIGMTDELSVGAYFKRLTVMDSLFGNRRRHLQVLADSYHVTEQTPSRDQLQAIAVQ